MASPASRSWHHWPVALVAIGFHGVLAADYALTQTEYGPWVSGLTPDQLGYFRNLPEWAVAGWAMGGWVGLVGSLMMAVRAAFAPLVLLVALAGMSVTALALTLAMTPDYATVAGPLGVPVLIAVLAVQATLFLYARQSHVAGRR